MNEEHMTPDKLDVWWTDMMAMWEMNPHLAPWNVPPFNLEERIQHHGQHLIEYRQQIEKLYKDVMNQSVAISPQDTASPITVVHSDADTGIIPLISHLSQRVLGVLTEVESGHVAQCLECRPLMSRLLSQLAMHAQVAVGVTSTLQRQESPSFAGENTQALEQDATTSEDLRLKSYLGRDPNESEVRCANFKHESNDWGLIHINSGMPELRCYKHETPDHYMIIVNGDTTTPVQVSKK